MLTPIRRSPALRLLPLWIVVISVNASVVMGLLVLIAFDHKRPVPAVPLVLLGWLGIAAYLTFGKVRTRSSTFDLTLPHSARRLWLNHVLGVLTGGGFIILATLAVVWAHWLLLPRRVEMALTPFELLAYLFSGLALAVTLMAAYRSSLAEVPVTPDYVLRTGMILIAVLAVLLLLTLAPIVSLIIPLTAALVIGVRAYRSLPGALTVVPYESAPADLGAESTEMAGEYARSGGETVAAEPAGALRSAGALSSSGDIDGSSRWIVWTTMLRAVSAGWKDVLGLPLIAILGIFLGGVMEVVTSDSDVHFLRFMYIPLATYLLFAMVPPRLGRLHNIDYLPVSRRLMFAVLVIPVFAAMWIGYGAGVFSIELFGQGRELVNFQGERDYYRVSVPFRFVKVDWDGQPPMHESPWGETHEPPHAPPLRGTGVVLYSPFSVTEDSSKKFVALQISRAVEAIYGASIAPDEIESRYLELQEDGKVGVKGAGLTLRQDFPQLSPRRAGPMFPFMMAIVSLPWLLLVGVLFRAYRVGFSNAVRLTIFWGSLSILLVLMIGQAVGMVAGFAKPWLSRALVELPVQWMGQSLAVTIAVWVLSGLLLIVTYRIAETQFVRMEIPTRPTKYSLIDCIQEANAARS